MYKVIRPPFKQRQVVVYGPIESIIFPGPGKPTCDRKHMECFITIGFELRKRTNESSEQAVTDLREVCINGNQCNGNHRALVQTWMGIRNRWFIEDNLSHIIKHSKLMVCGCLGFTVKTTSTFTELGKQCDRETQTPVVIVDPIYQKFEGLNIATHSLRFIKQENVYNEVTDCIKESEEQQNEPFYKRFSRWFKWN